MSSSFDGKLEQAKSKLPLHVLMTQFGMGPTSGHTKFSKCPFCNHKDSAGLFQAPDGATLFKCHYTSCPTGAKAFDQVGFLEIHLRLSREDAFREFLKMTGFWEERERHAPSVMPGKAGRKKPLPVEAKVTQRRCAACDREFVVPEHEAESDVVCPHCSSPVSRPPSNQNLPPQSGQPEHLNISSQAAAESESAPTSGAVELSAGPASLEPLDRKDNTGGVPQMPDPSPDAGISSPATGASVPPSAGEPFLTEAGKENRQITDGETAECNSAALLTDGKTAECNSAALLTDGKTANPAALFEADLRRCLGWAQEHKECSSALFELKVGLSFARSRDVMMEMGRRGLAEILETTTANITGKLVGKVPSLTGGGGGGDGGNGGGGTEPTDEGVPMPLRALRYFYRRLQLLPEHREKLWTKRGLTPETCEAAGLVSSCKANREVLVAMEKVFPRQVLVEAGLYAVKSRDPKAEPVPNDLFWGYGISGVKPKEARRHRDDKWIYAWCNPVLIPYFDEKGELLKLRPHKGGLKEDPARLFIPRAARSWREKNPKSPMSKAESTFDHAVITEGEFKALALWQALGTDMAVASLPGITLAKLLRADIEDWLSDGNARIVTVAYDNEDKGTKGLPGYKEESWKRHDTQVWARFLARQVSEEGYEGRVCVLPDAWRENGKADWDGALAALIAKDGMDGSRYSPSQIWERVKSDARGEFLRVLKTAVRVNELWQSGFFDSEAERVIKNKLENLCYVPRLPVGDDGTEAMARRIQRFLKKTKGDKERLGGLERGFLINLAKRYLDLKGGYYIFKRPGDKIEARWTENLAKAASDNDVEFRRICEAALLGRPERISDFYMECRYTLKKVNGKVDRLVVLKNIHGNTTEKSGLVPMPSSDFAQPARFREWLLNQGGFTWRAGERELNDLQADVARYTAFKHAGEVAVRGWHEDSKLWFFADAAITPEGEQVLPDKNGIFWYQGQGYRLSEKDQEGEPFIQQTPRMNIDRADPPENGVQHLFREVSSRFLETVADYDGWLVMGWSIACGAGPEIYKTFTGFPGLWLHGETEQGKSSVARWLLRFWGFVADKGITIKGSSQPGLGVAMQQYGNLPVWLEEFQPNAEEALVERVKNFYNRESGIKKTFGEPRREIRACPMITGIATSRDAQVLNRYIHVQVAAKLRRADHYRWFEDNKEDFFFSGEIHPAQPKGVCEAHD